MFDLDREVSRWRRAMAEGGISAPAVLDELESHLRDHVEQQVRSGGDLAQAFRVATERIGEAGVLQREFARAANRLSIVGLLAVVDDRRRCIWGAVVLAALAAFGTFWWKARVAPVYEGLATVHVLQRPTLTADSVRSVQVSDVQSAERLNAILRLLSSARLRDRVAASLTSVEQRIVRGSAPGRSLREAPEPAIAEQLGELRIMAQRLSLLVTISVIHPEPAAAPLLANRYASELESEVANLYDSGSVVVRRLESAPTPGRHFAPNLRRIAGTSAVVGAVTFVVLMLLVMALRMLARLHTKPKLQMTVS